MTDRRVTLTLLAICMTGAFCLLLGGCSQSGGYSSRSLYPEGIHTIYLNMFDSRSFRRGTEFDLTDALAKRIEAETPYKLVSSSDRADSVLRGQIVSISESFLTAERETGMALEKEVQVKAVVNWKDLRSGALLIDNKTVTAAASYSEFQMQDFTYASALAANKLAQKVVELMEKSW